MRIPFVLFFAFGLFCFAGPADQQALYLQAILRQADEAYYNKNQSLMSDEAYDALRHQYEQLVASHPNLTNALSIGASPALSTHRIQHSAPILSLQKAYSDESVAAFVEKCGRNLLYCIEPKLDGLTVVLRYHDGLLTRALTRGDGETGIDISATLLASAAVPAALKNAPARLEVRAEAFLPR